MFRSDGFNADIRLGTVDHWTFYLRRRSTLARRELLHYWFRPSRTLACRASHVFLASPSNMAVLGL